eukprot:gnl/MRDRNA2_/MRDRNA2_18146_c0_seq1.p1 gnl/MRDRNA2_/MRDRNA2_18146_c0~~gnl/MRDRNA2_/MRDRNA2_18146_c0_seq1.p1  ORF type:complete len:298 (-),score=44.39 gnl/MRDRNA2_/MRDRNA2_18146_c0_seq1:111-1004(-)
MVSVPDAVVGEGCIIIPSQGLDTFSSGTLAEQREPSFHQRVAQEGFVGERTPSMQLEGWAGERMPTIESISSMFDKSKKPHPTFESLPSVRSGQSKKSIRSEKMRCKAMRGDELSKAIDEAFEAQSAKVLSRISSREDEDESSCSGSTSSRSTLSRSDVEGYQDGRCESFANVRDIPLGENAFLEETSSVGSKHVECADFGDEESMVPLRTHGAHKVSDDLTVLKLEYDIKPKRRNFVASAINLIWRKDNRDSPNCKGKGSFDNIFKPNFKGPSHWLSPGSKKQRVGQQANFSDITG